MKAPSPDFFSGCLWDALRFRLFWEERPWAFFLEWSLDRCPFFSSRLRFPLWSPLRGRGFLRFWFFRFWESCFSPDSESLFRPLWWFRCPFGLSPKLLRFLESNLCFPSSFFGEEAGGLALLKSSTRGRSLDGTNSPIGAELAVVEVWASRGFSFARCQRERILDFIKVRERKFPWLIGFWTIRKQRVFGNEWITKLQCKSRCRRG